jgi:hypothetical protein
MPNGSPSRASTSFSKESWSRTWWSFTKSTAFRRYSSVGRKRTRETETIAESDEPKYLEDLARLAQALEEAHTRSVLPEEPPNRDELEELVIELRTLL